MLWINKVPASRLVPVLISVTDLIAHLWLKLLISSRTDNETRRDQKIYDPGAVDQKKDGF